MKQNLSWLQKEINKDKEEVINNKKQFIKDILKTPKEQITEGPRTIQTESIWKKLLNKLKGR